MTLKHFEVGDTVIIRASHMQAMESSNRSCLHPQYPSDRFLGLIRPFVGVVGEVTHSFKPGYDVTARFPFVIDGEKHTQSFHMKGNWLGLAEPEDLL